MTPDQIQPGKTYKMRGCKKRRRVVSVENGVVVWYDNYQSPMMRGPLARFAASVEREATLPLKDRKPTRVKPNPCSELGIEQGKTYIARINGYLVLRTVTETRRKWVEYRTPGDSLFKIMTAKKFHNELVEGTPPQ